MVTIEFILAESESQCDLFYLLGSSAAVLILWLVSVQRPPEPAFQKVVTDGRNTTIRQAKVCYPDIKC